VTGPGLTLYYSKLDDGTDREVQVCLPVHPTDLTDLDRLNGDTSLDQLPGGTVATTTATDPDQSEYPGILDAYDAVASWAAGHGYVPSGPPPEIAHDPQRIEVAWLLDHP